MSRGMTLLETVLALALLSALFAGTGWWLREAAEMRARAVAPLRFEQAARAALDRVAESLAVGDFERSDDRARPRVRLADGALEIRTRRPGAEGGPAIRAFGLDRARGALVERTRDASPGALETGGAEESVVLVGELQDVAFSLDPKTRVLRLELRPSVGEPVSRRYRAP